MAEKLHVAALVLIAAALGFLLGVYSCGCLRHHAAHALFAHRPDSLAATTGLAYV